jgi:hypothetical protein
MPYTYQKELLKEAKTEFSILANYNLRVRIDILLYSGLFTNYLAMFLETANV